MKPNKILLPMKITFMFLCLCALTLPAWTAEKAQSSPTDKAGVVIKNPATDLWRAIRGRKFNKADQFSATTQMKSMNASSLVDPSGIEWLKIRKEKLIPYGAYLLAGVFLILILFRLIRGKIKVKAGLSGIKILRFSSLQRFIHWSVAILFIILALTGLMLTFGRDGLIPLIGNEAFGNIANLGKVIHDYLGPVFGIMLVLMLITYIKGNFPTWTDIKWFLKGGGLLGGHASAGRYNGGEKAWFWLAIFVGGAIIATGLIMEFPFFGQTRQDIMLSQLIHASAAIILVAASLGHIYMGTVGMEGAIESMKTGCCDENWAREHHDLWYQQLIEKDQISYCNRMKQYTQKNS